MEMGNDGHGLDDMEGTFGVRLFDGIKDGNGLDFWNTAHLQEGRSFIGALCYIPVKHRLHVLGTYECEIRGNLKRLLLTLDCLIVASLERLRTRGDEKLRCCLVACETPRMTGLRRYLSTYHATSIRFNERGLVLSPSLSPPLFCFG
jgi:hypothetical protein